MNPAVNPFPLAGRRIVVTRPKGQAESLSALIRRAGGEPLEVPALEIQDLADLGPFFSVADRLDSFDCAIFVSRNAVRRALALIAERGGGRPWPARLRVATVGAGSREELIAQGFSSVVAPAGQSDSEALLALPEFADVAGKRIAIFRGEGGRKYLGEALAARRALVEHAPCYRRALPAGGGALLAAAWEGGKVDAVIVSSGEGLANFMEMLGSDGPRRLAGIAFFVPHPRVARDAARQGLEPVIIAGPGDAEVAAALVAYFGGASYN
jgi:uroporphyrinogen-III synthase